MLLPDAKKPANSRSGADAPPGGVTGGTGNTVTVNPITLLPATESLASVTTPAL
jgi:hypothetical protein